MGDKARASATLAGVLAFYIGATLYYTVFYRSRLIPRWLSVWGIAGTTFGAIGALLVLFRAIDTMSGLQVALNVPIAGIRSSDILAYAQPLIEDHLVIVLQAGRGRLITAHYDHDHSHWFQVGDFALTTAHELGRDRSTPTRICGELSTSDRELIEQQLAGQVHIGPPALSLRRAGYLAEMGWNKIRSGGGDDPVKLQPIYIAPISLEGSK